MCCWLVLIRFRWDVDVQLTCCWWIVNVSSLFLFFQHVFLVYNVFPLPRFCFTIVYLPCFAVTMFVSTILLLCVVSQCLLCACCVFDMCCMCSWCAFGVRLICVLMCFVYAFPNTFSFVYYVCCSLLCFDWPCLAALPCIFLVCVCLPCYRCAFAVCLLCWWCAFDVLLMCLWSGLMKIV